MTTWRVISSDARDGASLMALDRALLDLMEARVATGREPAPVLRFYEWSSPTVSIGRHQRFHAACDVDACRAAHVDLVQRPTGGRAVLHDDEVTYAVVAPASGLFAGPGVSRGSAVIAEALAIGLSRLGASVEVVKGSPGAAESPRAVRLACFATASRAEVVVGGRKLCGSAQLRGRAALLQHGSLPITFDAERQARLLGSQASFLSERATSLVEQLDRRPTRDEIEQALVAGFVETLGAPLEPSSLDDEELARAAELDAAWRSDPLRWGRAAGEAHRRAMEEAKT